jgi:hypothetical protein
VNAERIVDVNYTNDCRATIRKLAGLGDTKPTAAQKEEAERAAKQGAERFSG